MTGELAPARHVPSAATRGWEPVSDLPRGAALVAATHPGWPGPGDRHIRQNQTRPIWLQGYRRGSPMQAKGATRVASSHLGITQWITLRRRRRNQTDLTKAALFRTEMERWKTKLIQREPRGT